MIDMIKISILKIFYIDTNGQKQFMISYHLYLHIIFINLQTQKTTLEMTKLP